MDAISRPALRHPMASNPKHEVGAPPLATGSPAEQEAGRRLCRAGWPRLGPGLGDLVSTQPGTPQACHPAQGEAQGPLPGVWWVLGSCVSAGWNTGE